jgi:diaminopimelate epimerase
MTISTYTFRKMNGLGNDFAVFDARGSGIAISNAQAKRIADRVNGIGCDQIIEIRPSGRADAFMRILNADGSEVDACGNATRCVAALLGQEKSRENVVIETGAGLLACTANADGTVTVDMGEPRLAWSEIPLSRSFPDTVSLDVAFDDGRGGLLRDPGAVNVGNPHAVFFVDDADAYDLTEIGPRIEHDPLFPEAVNVSLAQILSPDAIRLRVWERGSGATKACGTAACAAAVAVIRKGLTDRKVTVSLPGGDLDIEWRGEDGHILMTGPWMLDYEGVWELAATEPATA